MNTSSVLLDKPASGAWPGAQRGERNFWSGLALIYALVAFVGFAPSYYLKAHFGAGPELTPLLRVHGILMSAWLVLLVVQTSLIRAGQVAWHRRLGVAGGVLAAAMAVVFTVVALQRARQGVLGPGTVPPLVFLSLPLMSVLVFPGLVAAALYNRRRSDYHKRLIMLAGVELMLPAVARLMAFAGLPPPAAFPVVDLAVVAIAVHDLRTRRRLHPATIWGGVFVIASQPLRILATLTPFWMPFAKWLIG